MSPWIVVLSLLSSPGCGDDPVVPTDAGSDSGRVDASAPVDSGPDAAAPPDAGPVGSCESPGPYPAPDSWTPNRGPGGPAASFEVDELYDNCAFLDGGELDMSDHHNLVTMYDGYLLMPWAPEFSQGGLTFFDISAPCNPSAVGTGYSETMRETHSIGFSQLRGSWAVVNQLTLPLVAGGGIQFWDVSDPTAPQAVADLELPGVVYPDAYARVTLSVFWQVPYVYVGGADNGVYVVNATDPTAPFLVNTYPFEPTLRVGQVQVVGNLLVATSAEGARTALLDVSDPENPQPIPGGDFLARDADGNPREAYFTNIANGYVWYARKEGGGGLMVYDISDPENPTRAGGYRSDGNGGYVFIKDNLAFTGESRFAAIYDISDLSDIQEVTRLSLTGDLDTATPIGNVVVLSVDDEADDDRGSAIAPFATEPDADAPRVTWAHPPDGEQMLPATSRFGVTFSEFIDVRSAFAGSVRLYETGTDPDETRVPGVVSAQEVIVNFHPNCPLSPDTDYTLEIPAGGVVDFNGNAIAEPFTATFRTAP